MSSTTTISFQPRIAVLIAAAGSGRRMGRAVNGAVPRAQARRDAEEPETLGDSVANKVLLPLGGEPVLRHTVRAFHDLAELATLRVVGRREDYAELDKVFGDRRHWARLGPWVEGGPERQDSVRRGLRALEEGKEGPPDWILVHDGARPLCSRALIQRVLAALQRHSAVVPVVHPVDTVRGAGAQLSAPGIEGSAGVQPRSSLRLSQTPQAFHWRTLRDAHVAGEGLAATDDAQLVERLGGSVALIPGERRNFKITLPDDLALAEWALQHPEWGLSS